jgi:hypothetical protein
LEISGNHSWNHRCAPDRGKGAQGLCGGAFLTDGQQGIGPAAAPPGKELRSELVLRMFAVERFLSFVIFGGAA